VKPRDKIRRDTAPARPREKGAGQTHLDVIAETLLDILEENADVIEPGPPKAKRRAKKESHSMRAPTRKRGGAATRPKKHPGPMTRDQHFKLAMDLIVAREALRRLLKILGPEDKEAGLAWMALGLKWEQLREQHAAEYPATETPYDELWGIP